jgi:UDP-3-O-[3-hydroxymyristoyl] glucosamine N-acyltransferase
MKISARVIAEMINGDIVGDPERVISGPCGIESAENEHISFLGNPKYESYVYTTKAGILLVPNDFIPSGPLESTLIKVENVYAAVAQLLAAFDPSKSGTTADVHHATAIIASDVLMGKNVQIGAGCVIDSGAKIGNNVSLGAMVWIGSKAEVGENSVLHAGVKVYRDCVIGARCVIQANTVIGSDGFGYTRDESGKFSKVPQIGKVVLEDDVELGANCCIDRATMGETRIGRGVKMDNLVHIAHNVRIGADTALAAQVGIAGSTQIGERCLIGGQVGFAGHIKIANGNEFQAQSGVASNIEKEGGKWFGYPAFEYMKYVRSYAVFKKLPELMQLVYQIDNKMKKNA